MSRHHCSHEIQSGLQSTQLPHLHFQIRQDIPHPFLFVLGQDEHIAVQNYPKIHLQSQLQILTMLYHIITLGCQMNKSDSERVRTVLDKMGFRWTSNEKEAQLLGILACSVRQKAINKVYSRISLWNKWKNKKRFNWDCNT